jgi:dephospho-CoA kinase
VEAVREKIGEEFVSEGELEKAALRDAISQQVEVRHKLNAILHPPVMAEVMARTETPGVAFAEVPLLVETATQGWFDEVWVVAAGAQNQLERLTQRLGSKEAARRLLETQLPTAAKIPFADRVIRTNEAVETVKLTIADHVRRLVEE